MPLILVIGLSLIGGILVSSALTSIFHSLVFPLMIVLIALIAWSFRFERQVLVTGLSVSCFLLGVIRYQQWTPGPNVGSDWIQFYNRNEVVLEGIAVEPPNQTGRVARVVIVPRQISVPQHESDTPVSHTDLRGRVLLVFRAGAEEIKYGDRLRLRGELREPPEIEGFSYKEYLSVGGVYSLMEFPDEIQIVAREQGNFVFAFLYWLRNKLLEKLEVYFPEPHASLLAGIVLGVKRSYTDSFYEAMRVTGVLHVIVASGFNINILMNKTAVAVAGLKRWKQTIILAVVIIAYTVIAGFEPPIVRAAIMGAITYLALITGRRKHGLLALLLVAAAMLVFRPVLYKSLSFQLSFGATSALVLINPYFRGRFPFLPREVGDALGTTLAVQVMLIPWIIYKFSSVSFIAPLANMLVLPMIGEVMLYGLIWLIFSFFMPAVLTSFLSWFLWVVMEYFVRMVRFFGNFSWAGAGGVKVNLWLVMGYYLILAWLLWKMRRKVSSSK